MPYFFEKKQKKNTQSFGGGGFTRTSGWDLVPDTGAVLLVGDDDVATNETLMGDDSNGNAQYLEGDV